MLTTLLSPWFTILSTLPPPGSAAASLLIAYLLFEVGFYFHYRWNLIPIANRIQLSKPPAPYRDYENVDERAKLLCRIIDRLGKRVPKEGTNNDNDNPMTKSEVYYKFIESWFIKRNKDAHYKRFSEQFDMVTLDGGFCPPPPPMLRMAWTRSGMTESASDSSLVSNDKPTKREDVISNHPSDARTPIEEDRLQRDNLDEFLSWAFFGVHYSTVQSTPSMQQSLDHFYKILETEAELTFESGRNRNYTPRNFTFEEVNSIYRPYAVYASVALMRTTAKCILTIIGFKQYTCSRGLRYWHRPAKIHQGGDPFLFFHGIAPGGHAPYLPMIFFGLLRNKTKHHDIFLFENKPISYALCFGALSEEDTVHGVIEAIEQHLGSDHTSKKLTLCGHSFGSCQLTWMLQSPLRNRIGSLILIDPVSILLSEPDVMINFLYTRSKSEPNETDSNSWIGKAIRFLHESKIYLVASSELFIEHYLRRNFAWYNSELWLADIPHDVKVLVCLAEHDEIVNSLKVEREILEHIDQSKANPSSPSVVEMIFWKGVGHAHCISDPEKWFEIRDAMDQMASS
eukprot:scaffold4343_cov195-Alexandrium_tamarense.AAC.12